MAYRLDFDTDNFEYNRMQALKAANQMERSTKDLRFHFVKDKDKQCCIITTFNEHESLPEAVKACGVDYNSLKTMVLS